MCGGRVRSSAFGIQNFREQYFCVVIGNGVDDSFDMENGSEKEFIDTGKWKKNF